MSRIKHYNPQTNTWEYADACFSAGGGSGGNVSAPSDWNAAEGEAGHVLNRTHYMETGETLMAETTFEGSDGTFTCVYSGEALVSGELVEVTYNGQKYICTIRLVDGFISFGYNPAVGKDKGVPFVCVIDEGMLLCMPFDGATAVTMSIARVNVHPLAEYLLANGRYEIFLGSLAVEGSECEQSYDDIAKALHSGRQVVLVVVTETVMVEYQVVSWTWASEVGLTIYYTTSTGVAFITFPNGTWTPAT